MAVRIMDFKKLKLSFKCAFEGLRLALHEQTFKMFCVIALLTIILMFALNVSFNRKITLILVITLLLGIELINSQVERTLDIIDPSFNHKIKAIKDISAAAVFLASFGAAVIGILVFFPYIIQLF